MRNASVLGARLALGIRQDPQCILFESRARPVILHIRALMAAPFVVLQRFGPGAVASADGASDTGDHHATAKERPAVKQAIAGDRLESRWFGTNAAIPPGHGFPLGASSGR
jgi:hypothetical protein